MKKIFTIVLLWIAILGFGQSPYEFKRILSVQNANNSYRNIIAPTFMGFQNDTKNSSVAVRQNINQPDDTEVSVEWPIEDGVLALQSYVDSIAGGGGGDLQSFQDSDNGSLIASWDNGSGISGSMNIGDYNGTNPTTKELSFNSTSGFENVFLKLSPYYPVEIGELSGGSNLAKVTFDEGTTTVTAYNDVAINTTLGTVKINAKNAITSINGNEADDDGEIEVDIRPYKVYTALISQSSTNPPTAIVLENSLGTISFSYSDVGDYLIESDGLFETDKTFIILGSYNDLGSAGYKLYFDPSDITTDSIQIRTRIDPGNSTPANGQLYKSELEIRVYN